MWFLSQRCVEYAAQHNTDDSRRSRVKWAGDVGIPAAHGVFSISGTQILCIYRLRWDNGCKDYRSLMGVSLRGKKSKVLSNPRKTGECGSKACKRPVP